MAYDEGLAQRIRELLENADISYDEKRMFGGLAFMVNGNMCVGVISTQLMARVGANAYDQALHQLYVEEMDFTGKPLKGFVYVSAEGIEADEDLQGWIQRCHDFVLTLPSK